MDTSSTWARVAWAWVTWAWVARPHLRMDGGVVTHERGEGLSPFAEFEKSDEGSPWVWRAFNTVSQPCSTDLTLEFETENASYVPLLEFSILPILFCTVSTPPLLVELGADLVILLPKPEGRELCP